MIDAFLRRAFAYSFGNMIILFFNSCCWLTNWKKNRREGNISKLFSFISTGVVGVGDVARLAEVLSEVLGVTVPELLLEVLLMLSS